ncbi:hypothetical protein P5673_027564, partial [Acropora cervicornis]
MEAIDEEWIRRQVMVERKTHHEISEILKCHLPFNRGLSERSVRRFCENRGIHYRSGLDRRALASTTREAVQKVGPTWGCKMLKGYFRAQGVNICSKRIVLLHGVWDQVRVDMGAEFYLTLFVQDILSQHRRNTFRAPYVQTNSKQ